MATALLLVVVIIASSGAALADSKQDERDREKGRFAFGFAITSGVLIAQQNGFINPQALDIVDPPFVVWVPRNPTPSLPPFQILQTRRPEPFGSSVDGSVNTVSPNIGVNVEFMTPALEILPADPRFFLTAEILPTFATEVTVALQGAATEFLTPRQAPDTYPANAISGTGSRLRAQVMTSVLAANAGAAFSFEYRERLLRIKPSVGWIRWGVIASGKVLAAYKNDPLPQPPGAPFYGPETRLVEVAGRGSGFFNAVGPGVELEMELDKRGPIRPVLYAGAFGYRTVGNDTIRFQGSSGPITDWFNTFVQPAPNPPVTQPATYIATWTFQPADWSYRAALGFRLRWVGD